MMTAQLKLKKDGTPKKSGGARKNAGVKSALAVPEVRAQWDAELHRAICSAAANFFVLRKKSFYTTAQIAERFGKPAVAEFKVWFEAARHFDQEKADALYQKKAMGRITDDELKEALIITAYFWVWTIKTDHQQKAWAMSRGIDTTRNIKQEVQQ